MDRRHDPLKKIPNPWPPRKLPFGSTVSISVSSGPSSSQAGLWALNIIGLVSLGEDLAHKLPEALEHYVRGFGIAWGPSSQAYSEDHLRSFNAGREIARGHVLLISALLLALMAWFTRGKGDKGAMLQEIRESRRLGPKVAEWVQSNEDKFATHMAAMQLKPPTAGGAAGRAAPSDAARTPNQIAGKKPEEPPPSRKPEALKGEAAGRDYMQKNGFEKMSGDKRWNAPGTDDIWKNSKPPPDYVITEYKYGSSSLGKTADGKQTSDDWLNGVNTGRDRIGDAVGEAEAGRIKDALDTGQVEKWLLRVDDTGNVKKQLLDAAGNVIKGP